MNRNFLKRSLFVLVVTGLGILSLSKIGHAIQLQDQLDLDQVRPVLRPIAACGNGFKEDGEQCDHGLDNGTEGDTCKDNCEYNIPEGKFACVREYVGECYREKQAEFFGIDGNQIRRIDEEERQILDGFYEECVEAGIRLCTPDEDLDSVDLGLEDEENKDQSVEGSDNLSEGGGCSLGLGQTAANGWQILLGLGLLYTFKRRL